MSADPTPEEILARAEPLRKEYAAELAHARDEFTTRRFKYRRQRRDYLLACRVYHIRMDAIARIEAAAKAELAAKGV